VGERETEVPGPKRGAARARAPRVTDEVAFCILGIALGDVFGVIARRVAKGSRVHPTVNVNDACSSTGPARGLTAFS